MELLAGEIGQTKDSRKLKLSFFPNKIPRPQFCFLTGYKILWSILPTTNCVVEFGCVVVGLSQTKLPDVFPVRGILERKISFGNLGQEDIEIIIVYLYAADGIEAWSLLGWGFGKKCGVTIFF